MSKIEWICSKPLDNKDNIKIIESEFKIDIPSELKELISKNNSGHPVKSSIIIPNYGKTDFKMLLSFNKYDEETIFDVAEYFQKKYHGRVIPFAVDSGSGYFCIKDEYIVYIDTGEEIIIPIANDLEEFLTELN